MYIFDGLNINKIPSYAIVDITKVDISSLEKKVFIDKNTNIFNT